MEDGFWEALKALGEPTVGVDGFMVHIDGSHFIHFDYVSLQKYVQFII